MPRMPLRFVLAAVVTAAVALGAAGPVQAQGDKIYDKILKSTVWIIMPVRNPETGRTGIRMGTGTLIDAQKRIVLTNYHVVTDAPEVFVFFPAYKDKKLVPEREHYLEMYRNRGGIKAATVAREPKVDLALVQLEVVPEGAKVMPLAREQVSPGQSIHSVGNPGVSGALWIYTAGKVRQVYQKKFKSRGDGVIMDIDAQVVETDSPTNPGDSGGPLVNDRCELVGVTQGLSENARALSTFIDLSEVKTLLAKAKIRPVIASGAAPKETATTDKKEDKPATPAKTESAEEVKERQANFKLKSAKQFVQQGDNASAVEYFEEILTKFPMTKAATEAKALLDGIKKKK